MIRLVRFRRRLLPALLLASACGDGPTAPPTSERPGPLAPGTWSAHTLGGRTLPALMARRAIEGGVEERWADTVQIVVRPDGTWEQRVHVHVFENRLFRSEGWSVATGRQEAVGDSLFLVPDGDARRLPVSIESGGRLTLSLRGEGWEGAETARLEPGPPPPTPHGRWTAHAVHEHALPWAAYVFDPDETYGHPASVHMVLDSARLHLHVNDTYVQQLFVSEWEGDVGGGPHTKRFVWFMGDAGEVVRTTAGVHLESGWTQNHTLAGAWDGASTLRMSQGLSHGDPRVPIRFVRP